MAFEYAGAPGLQNFRDDEGGGGAAAGGICGPARAGAGGKVLGRGERAHELGEAHSQGAPYGGQMRHLALTKMVVEGMSVSEVHCELHVSESALDAWRKTYDASGRIGPSVRRGKGGAGSGSLGADGVQALEEIVGLDKTAYLRELQLKLQDMGPRYSASKSTINNVLVERKLTLKKVGGGAWGGGRFWWACGGCVGSARQRSPNAPPRRPRCRRSTS